MAEQGIALTLVGVCCNPACNAPLYAELMAEHDHEACFACDPAQFDSKGWHPAILAAFGVSDAEMTARIVAGHRLQGLCTEPCCANGVGFDEANGSDENGQCCPIRAE